MHAFGKKKPASNNINSFNSLLIDWIMLSITYKNNGEFMMHWMVDFVVMLT